MSHLGSFSGKSRLFPPSDLAQHPGRERAYRRLPQAPTQGPCFTWYMRVVAFAVISLACGCTNAPQRINAPTDKTTPALPETHPTPAQLARLSQKWSSAPPLPGSEVCLPLQLLHWPVGVRIFFNRENSFHQQNHPGSLKHTQCTFIVLDCH